MNELKEINNIYNEDSIEAMRNMESECVDLLVTDPPYKTITGGGGFQMGCGGYFL